MTGRVKKPVQDGRGVDQLAERRHRRGQPSDDVTPGPESPQRPPADLTRPRLVEPPAPRPYSAFSSLDLDDDPTEAAGAVPSPDEILDAFCAEPIEDDAVQDEAGLEEDEIGLQLHRHHERVRAPATGPREPRGSAELVAAPRPARRKRTSRPDPTSRRTSTAQPQAASKTPRRARALVVAGIVAVAVVVAVMAVVMTGSSPHPTAKPRPRPRTVVTSRQSGAPAGRTAALETRLLSAWTGTTTVGETLEHAVQQQTQLARHRLAARNAQARKNKNEAAGKAPAHHEHTAASAGVSSSAPQTSTTVSSGATVTAPSEPASTPSAASSDDGSSSSTGNSSSIGSAPAPEPAGPTGVGSASGCNPKCS
jgi:hypothetical protein